MSVRANIAFVAIFLIAFAAFSWFSTGSISWPMLIGGTLGAVVGIGAAAFVRKRRQNKPPEGR
jgi:LPXTG-motif cell wall-anchored protein